MEGLSVGARKRNDGKGNNTKKGERKERLGITGMCHVRTLA